ncbi:hypothetical protein CTA2_5934 [Colletotrichum tanaceti]|uniref:Uncharacterized protein n=1 Tax=Colletotrichum tanaceti TaxID=1306861 RepID=A0A4U6XGR9_9PEZI|nr:hypothetical protein CTA2_5934 [Colletotrichum tanaceti]TKW55090.1 hypothetical protein CTA1_6990 [Colletotrichum tanaceti]
MTRSKGAKARRRLEIKQHRFSLIWCHFLFQDSTQTLRYMSGTVVFYNTRNTMWLLRILALCSLALGAPYPPPDVAAESDTADFDRRVLKEAASTAAVFKIERFYAGGRSQSEWNYVTFAAQVTAGAAFAECSIATNTGPKVPTIEKTECRNATSLNRAIKWSLEPMGTGMMHFNVWWEFTSHAHLYGGVHMYQSWFKEWTVQDGNKVQEYVGPHSFTLDTVMSPTQPEQETGLKESHL